MPDQWTPEVNAGRMSIVAAERRRWLGVAEAERLEAQERAARRAKRAEAATGSKKGGKR